MASYADTYSRSLKDPDGFWAQAANAIDWDLAPTQVLDESDAPLYRWFPDGALNTCYNAVDRHVENGRGDQAALIYDSPVTDTVATWTYRQLRAEVARLAGGLKSMGVAKGDRVVIYMPMIPETVFAMLACARLGAVHSVVFGGFAANELATRIDDVTPKVIMSASCGIEPGRIVEYKPLLDGAIDLSTHQPEQCVILQREEHAATLTPGRDLVWSDLVADADPAECVVVAATDPLYVLYTSGTTGRPKGVVRDNGGHAVALAWSMKNIYNVDPGETYWAASDVGWVVGHSYIVYGPLIHGCTTVLYEGKPVGTPDPGAFWRVISQHNVSTLFTAPTALRAIKRDDPRGEYLEGHDMSRFRALFLAGERCDPDTLHWAEDVLGVPVIDHWWQTETGWPIVANPLGIEPLPIKPGSPTVPIPGWDVRVVDSEGNELPAGTIGEIVIKLPLPPGALPTLWSNDEGFIQSYLNSHPGYFITSDAGLKDKDGYVSIMSRIDDIINVAGHRLSTGGMEEVLAGHPDVAECAVIGVADQLKGQIPLGFAVLKAGVTKTPTEVTAELITRVRDQIGPVAAFKVATVVDRLPKTRSGKVLRGTMRAIADGTPWKMPATIDDPTILDDIEESLQELGYPR
ncbi:MAG: propionyl-CoA synthetase [Actinomycetota bacterium]|nr:propionyl-CoA synthetase [Actinomycetota bacterium]